MSATFTQSSPGPFDTKVLGYDVNTSFEIRVGRSGCEIRGFTDFEAFLEGRSFSPPAPPAGIYLNNLCKPGGKERIDRIFMRYASGNDDNFRMISASGVSSIEFSKNARKRTLCVTHTHPERHLMSSLDE